MKTVDILMEYLSSRALSLYLFDKYAIYVVLPEHATNTESALNPGRKPVTFKYSHEIITWSDNRGEHIRVRRAKSMGHKAVLPVDLTDPEFFDRFERLLHCEHTMLI